MFEGVLCTEAGDCPGDSPHLGELPPVIPPPPGDLILGQVKCREGLVGLV